MGISSSPATDSLSDFLLALRRPLEFVATASPTTARRTHLPARALADRGRALLGRGSAAINDTLRELCDDLERFETSADTERSALARRCLTRIERLGEVGSAPPAPAYRPFAGEMDAALEQLGKPVQFVRGVGPRRADMLRRFGIENVEQLLYHLPFRYEDRRTVRTIREARPGEEAGIVGEIVQLSDRVVGRARRRILEGVLRDETGLLGLTWYNQVTYFRARYRTGQKCLVYGRVEQTPGGGKRIVHPEVDLDPGETGQGVLAVYNKPTTMTVAAMRKMVREAVNGFVDLVPSALPAEVAAAAGVTDLANALRGVHEPTADSDIDALNAFRSTAHRSLVFDELFFLQLGLALRRRSIVQEDGIRLEGSGTLTERLRSLLPFTLTGAQERVLADIRADMAQPHPMNRLVHGDVGSGKTIVALHAALIAIENGAQAAFMAPTELLAEQHFRTVSQYTENLGVRTVLLTGDCTRAEKTRIYAELERGDIKLVVGTHALIQEGVRIPALGLGVIDEQHRFGVLQRAALRRLRAEEGPTPDILLMTATPIPRTLAMTAYGDLDVSALDELPPGRKPIRTMIFNESERARVYDLVKREIDSGRQAYVVYPLVETSEKEDLRDATTMEREFRDTVFAGRSVGLIHGRMKSEDKDAVMRRFRDGQLQLLVSTTVIEVGVDVPNATMMVIEHAERFGLSQLHQLRGRVGRGSEGGTCLLIAPYHRGEDVYRRLQAMRETNDGFRIAEVDLDLRGPGEFLGTRQSGLPDFRVANLVRDSRILEQARRAVDRWLEKDPTLERPESAALRVVLKHRWAGRLGLAQIG